MLQRVQSLFLIVALTLLALLFLLPLIHISEQTKVYCYEVRPLLLLAVLPTLGILVAIFLYKTRLVQIRVLAFAAVILAGLQGWIGYYYFFERIPGSLFSFTAVFPIMAAILILLAIRYIARDEAMVRSVNRLRR